MKRTQATPDQKAWMVSLGRRVKLARLKRNLAQIDLAENAGVGRLALIELEKGNPGTSLAVLVRVLVTLGYDDPLQGLLQPDPIGDEMFEFFGRKRAGRRPGVADF